MKTKVSGIQRKFNLQTRDLLLSMNNKHVEPLVSKVIGNLMNCRWYHQQTPWRQLHWHWVLSSSVECDTCWVWIEAASPPKSFYVGTGTFSTDAWGAVIFPAQTPRRRRCRVSWKWRSYSPHTDNKQPMLLLCILGLLLLECILSLFSVSHCFVCHFSSHVNSMTVSPDTAIKSSPFQLFLSYSLLPCLWLFDYELGVCC